MNSRYERSLTIGLIALLAGCASMEEASRTPGYRPLSAAEGRALVARLLPDGVKDRSGWATDIYAAFAVLDIPPTPENICAAVAVTAQESGFQVDPVVPGLAGIARREIDRRRESAGIPRFALDAALALPSTNGKSYGERLDTAKTEQQLSDVYEDFKPLRGVIRDARSVGSYDLQRGIVFLNEGQKVMQMALFAGDGADDRFSAPQF